MQTMLTKRDLAEHLKVHERTINNWMKNGTIPFLKVSGVVRFDLDQVQEALARHVVLAR